RNGAKTFRLSGIMDISSPLGYVGTAEVQSHQQVAGPGGQKPGEPIFSVVSLVNSDSGEALSYNAFLSQQVIGVTTVAFPLISKQAQDRNSEITIANLSDCFVHDIRLDFYDEDGEIVSSVCQNMLRPKHLEHIDFANYGNLPPEWVGGMVATAVRSENLCDPEGTHEPAIAAVVVDRHPDDSASGQESFPVFTDYAPDGVTDCAPPSSAGATNYAPLIYREFSGWDTEIEVQNLSSSDPALVQVRFLDPLGETIATMMDWIPYAPPDNSRSFVLSSTDTLPGRYYGVVVIQSQDYVDDLGDLVPAPDVSSRVTLRELDTGQVITYDAFSLDQTLGVTEIDL
ncbi:MAG: hypothetical protein FJY85_25560, partial [Deltaproteobacteria bacterium]|nr:hypothetical protein [Deltaproteobacteria bacterium]